MKTIIIGGVAGGASAATRLRRLDESHEIVVLERSGYVIGTELEEQGYVAFDATHEHDGRTAIRVITRTGMAAVPDVPAPERERHISLRRVDAVAELVVARADPANAREVMGYLAQFHRDGGTIVLVTHEEAIEQYAQRTVLIRDGRIQE